MMPTQNSPQSQFSRDKVELWLSPHRYRPYLSAANNDHGAAMDLYEWNIATSAAFLEVFARLEVVLRNSVDAILKQLEVPATARMRTHDGWWFGDRSFLSESAHNIFVTARDRLPQNDQHNRDKVFSELMFGFWTSLFGRDYENLCKNHLHKAFTNYPDDRFDREEVSSVLEELRKLRNLLAHHQPLHDQPLEELHEQAIDLVSWIDRDAGLWVQNTSRVPGMLAARPGIAPAVAVVVGAARAWPLYKSVAAYVCQPGRFFQSVSHIAFYTNNAIQPHVAKIIGHFDQVPWDAPEISRLLATKDPRDKRLATIIKESRQQDWTNSDTYQVFLLTSTQDAPITGHVDLGHVIPNHRTGRGSAFVQRQRYVSVDALRRANDTSELPALE